MPQHVRLLPDLTISGRAVHARGMQATRVVFDTGALTELHGSQSALPEERMAALPNGSTCELADLSHV